MTIFICISENMREMFRLKQNSSRFSVADVCFLRAEVFQRMRDFSEQPQLTPPYLGMAA